MLTSEPPLGHLDAHRQQLREHRHRVGDVDDLLVAQNLGDEVARVGQVADDGHAHAQHEDIGVLAQEGLDHGLGVGVVGAREVGLVVFREALARTLGERVIVVEDASRGVCGEVDARGVADVREVEHSQDVGPDGIDLEFL